MSTPPKVPRNRPWLDQQETWPTVGFGDGIIWLSYAIGVLTGVGLVLVVLYLM